MWSPIFVVVLMRSVLRNRRRGVAGEAGAVRPERDAAGGVGRESRIVRPKVQQSRRESRACFSGDERLRPLRVSPARRATPGMPRPPSPARRRTAYPPRPRGAQAGNRLGLLLDAVEKRDPLGQHTLVKPVLLRHVGRVGFAACCGTRRPPRGNAPTAR